MDAKCYIACDLYAESSRVMLGRLEDGWLAPKEMHRFPTAAGRVLGSLRWEMGVQLMPINTIYHLVSDVEKSPALIDVADCFLTIAPEAWGTAYQRFIKL